MVKHLLPYPLMLALLLLVGCQGPNLAERIDTNMQDFDSWPLDVQETVREGRIDIGFTEEQVRVAWGEPDYVTRDRLPDGEGERWVWEKKSPRVGIGVGVGTGGSRGGVGGTVGTSVGGQNRVKRSVWFEDGEVVSYTE